MLSAATGKAVSLGDTFNPSTFGNRKTIVAFFTHAGDFNSTSIACRVCAGPSDCAHALTRSRAHRNPPPFFLAPFRDAAIEESQKLQHYLPQLNQAGVQLVAVVIGSPDNARAFAEISGFPLDKLYCDPEALAYKTFGFSRGFLPDVPINPYLRLLPMLAGIGSPGTIQAVLRGYVGDKNADASWTSSLLRKEAGGLVDKSAFDVLGTEGARPFEVATVRLQNMIKIIPNWERLKPANENLITQQGGCLVFEGRKLVRKYEDKGILTYVDFDDLLRVVGVKQ